MAHKEWEPDEFLDEFLDFDYRKPVPDQKGKKSRGLPADKPVKTEQPNRSFGLADDFKEYEALRHANNRSAGDNSAGEAKAQNLRSSGALQQEILEPLSARRAGKPQPASGSTAGTAAKAPEPVIDKKSAPAAPAASDTGKSSGRKPLFGRKNARASELAAEALGAAKKLVSTDEDMPPEVIPPAQVTGVEGFISEDRRSASSSSADRRSASSASAKKSPAPAAAAPVRKKPSPKKQPAPAPEKDEVSELFRELGESPSKPLTSAENAALKQAQQDAYDRYRGNYKKLVRKKTAPKKVGAFPKWLSRIYVLALAVFAVVMTVMDVLPAGMLIAFYVVLGLLSIIILMQLRRENVQTGIRAVASFTAILLIAGFGVGTAYAMGTLSFLDTTSVKNEKKVAAITRQPFNVCITGIDVDGTIDEQGRSDVNMIVTVNPKTEQILMTSIPRDYEIYMPDKDNAMDKLTHTGFYSVETTIGAEEQLLETQINYYVKVNFTTVEEFIDAIGGVDVYSDYEFVPVKKDDWTVQEGWNHMDGSQALAFARERKAFIDGDNQRIKNQQAVFEAMIKKATSSKTMLLSYNKILTNLRDYFRMSFSSSELRSLVKLQLAKNPEWKIYKNTIIGGNGSMPTYTTGGAYAYVMTQDQTSIDNAKTLINAVLEGKTLDKDDDNNVFVVGGEDEETTGEDGE